jgi:hypothetical protein
MTDPPPYHLFAGNAGRPGGGMNDYAGAFPTLDAALAAFEAARRADPYFASFAQVAERRADRLVTVAAWHGQWTRRTDAP